MKLRILALILIFTAFFIFEATISWAQTPASAELITAQAVNDKRIRLSKKLGAEFTREEQQKLKERANFRIGYVDTTDPTNPKIQDVTNSLIADPNLDTVIGGTRRIVCSGGRILTGAECKIITIELDNPLDMDKIYVFIGLEFDDGIVKPFAVTIPAPEIKKPPKATITAALDGSRDGVRVVAPDGASSITATSPITVKDNFFKLSENGDRAMSDSANLDSEIYIRTNNDIVNGKPQAESENKSAATVTSPVVELEIEKKLSEERSHNLSIESGLVNADTNLPIPAFGTIKLTGLPRKADDLKFEFRFSTEAGVKQKPFFNFFANLAPKSFRLAQNFYWEPALAADLGLGASKSNNSIEIKLPFRSRIFVVGKSRNANTGNLSSGQFAAPNYYRWRQIPWFKYEGSTYFYYGPKIEADRKFARVNLLGNLLFEFRMRRWRGSIGQQRAYLLSDAATSNMNEETANAQGLLTEDQIKQIVLKTGFSFTPFLGFDFGKKMTEETVTSKNNLVEVSIPKYNILRAYTGFRNIFEWEMFSFPTSFSIEETLYFLGEEEVIGVSENNFVNLRRLRGFQPRSKVSFDLYFNPVRSYSFNVTYENGRKAPNFEYLNKISAGFRIIY